MDLAGLLNRTVLAIEKINWGRKGFAADGAEHQRRLDYELSISLTAARLPVCAPCSHVPSGEQARNALFGCGLRIYGVMRHFF